jgi:phage tail-like protein
VAPSSYLSHLPPVVWAQAPVDAAPPVSLGDWLRIVEKVLTGIDDGVPLPHGDHDHPAITDVLSGVSELFDPWKTPADFLPYLASWVALPLPTLRGEPLWSEYQRRRVTAAIATIHRRRGLKAGMRAYLDLYSLGPARPRVAIDDGSRVLVVTPQPDAPAPVSVLVSQGPVLRGKTVVSEGLIRPWCAARTGAGDLVFGDTGVPASISIALPGRIWRINRSGAYQFSGSPPKPQPMAPGTALTQVIAVAVRPAAGGTPETLYALDRQGTLFAVVAPYDAAKATAVTSLASGAATFAPVAMAVDVGGNLLVLDRGDGPGTVNPPAIITVTPAPVAVSRQSLATVLEPMSLLVQADGSLLVGDGREQSPAGPDQFSGNLIRVDRSNAAAWAESPLLPPGNPLVAPTGLATTPDGTLYVLDAGLKPLGAPDDPFVRSVAAPASVFRVDPGPAVPEVIRVSEPGYLVFPTGMIADGERLVICDPGQPEVAGVVPVWPRLQPHRFDIVIHFLDGGLPADPQERPLAQNQVVAQVRDIVEDNRPAHTQWGLITAV